MTLQLKFPDHDLALMEKIQKAVKIGESNLTDPLTSFSDKSPQEVYEICKKIFNIYRKDVVKEIQDKWKTDSRRPTSRNIAVVVIAHLINELIVPSVKAQTKESEHDEKAARVMRDLLDYVQDKIRYRREMLFTLLEAVASPSTVVKIGYAEGMKNERYYVDGVLNTKKIVDDVASGFFFKRIRLSNFLVANKNIYDIQKQDWVIERDLISFDTATQFYSDKPAFADVRPGIYLSCSNGQLIEDANNRNITGKNLVERIEYYNRAADIHAVVLNGVIVADQPIQRLDKKYPFTHVGYEPITNEAEFYTFPLIWKLKEDQQLLEESYNVIMDGMKLDAKPPTIVNRRIGPKAFIPGSYTVSDDGFESKQLINGRSINGGLQAAQLLENSFERASPSSQAGIKPQGEQSRYQFQVLADNAGATHGVFKSLIREFVYDITELQISDIQQYITKNALEKLVQGVLDIETIVIPKSALQDKTVDKEIRWVSPLASTKNTLDRSYNIWKAEKNTKRKISEVNPLVYLNIKFSVFSDPEVEMPENKIEKMNINKEMYMLLRQDPLINHDMLVQRYVRSVDPHAVQDIVKSRDEVAKVLADQKQAQENPQIKQMGGADNAPRIPTV